MRIIVESGAAATGRTYCTQFQAAAELPLQPIGCAIWRDRFEKDEEGWHFIERWTDGRLTGDFRARLRSDATIVPLLSTYSHAVWRIRSLIEPCMDIVAPFLDRTMVDPDTYAAERAAFWAK